MQFLETALRDRETARRVGRRADWVVQSIVGGDRALRADVASLVVRRIQEPDAPPEVRFACARLGLAVNVTDRAWAEHSADALLVALRDPQTDQVDFPLLAEALAAVCEHLPPTQAADRAAAALDIFLTLLHNSAGKRVDHLSLRSSHRGHKPAVGRGNGSPCGRDADGRHLPARVRPIPLVSPLHGTGCGLPAVARGGSRRPRQPGD